MRYHRFTDNFDFKKKEFEVLQPEIVHQIKKVLRPQQGDLVICVDGKQYEALAKIIAFEKNRSQLNYARANPRGFRFAD